MKTSFLNLAPRKDWKCSDKEGFPHRVIFLDVSGDVMGTGCLSAILIRLQITHNHIVYR